MTTRDDDIEFDFFEEPATQEASQRARGVAGPRRDGEVRRAARAACAARRASRRSCG